MKIENDIKLDFSDVLIRPKRSTLSSRSEVSLEREFIFKRRDGSIKFKWTGVPVVAANMSSTGTLEMYYVLSKYKMITCLHKHYNLFDIPLDLDSNYYAISTGISDNDFTNLQQFIRVLKPKFVCIDVANGYMLAFAQFCKKVSEMYPDIVIIAGNVCTNDMMEELIINCGVDIVKAGVGGGSVCKTREKTGVGYPQLSMILENDCHGVGGRIMSDGGIITPADVCKAFCANADFVMIGSLFACYDESGGELVTDPDGKQYKLFYGMSSSHAMNKYSGGVANYRTSEGKVVKLPYKGSVENAVLDILGGLRSCGSYIGAKDLRSFSKCCTFIRVNNQLNNSLNKYDL
jgi:GMP reductase